MSDVVARASLRGNKTNYHQRADVVVYDGGYVRIQQDGDRVDVVLLTPAQVREIAKLAEEAR